MQFDFVTILTNKFDALTSVELALEHEVEMIEVQLKLLVCKVDAELLERAARSVPIPRPMNRECERGSRQ